MSNLTKLSTSTKIALVSLLSILVAVVLLACTLQPATPPADEDTQVAITIGYRDKYATYTTPVESNQPLGKHIDTIVSKYNLHSLYSGSNILGGRYIQELADLRPDAALNQYIFVLSSVDDPVYTGGMGIQVEYDGIMYYDLNYGIDDKRAVILQDAKYLITIIEYSRSYIIGHDLKTI
jgi:hypothetical protein